MPGRARNRCRDVTPIKPKFSPDEVLAVLAALADAVACAGALREPTWADPVGPGSRRAS